MRAENKDGAWCEIRLEKYEKAVLEHWEAMLISLSRNLKELIFMLPLSPLLAQPMHALPKFSF